MECGSYEQALQIVKNTMIIDMILFQIQKN